MVKVIVIIIIINIIIVINIFRLGQHHGPSKTHVIRRVLISMTACQHPHRLSQPQLYRHTATARGRVGTTELGVESVVHRDPGCDTSVFPSTPHSGGEDVGSRHSRREHARCVVIATTFIHLYCAEDNWFVALCPFSVYVSGIKHHRPGRLF